MINNISKSCEILKLNGVLQSYQSIADESCKVRASYSEYLDQILNHELMVREHRAREMVLKKANLTERQLKVVAYLKKNNVISNSEYQKIAEVSSRTATRELNELKEKGILLSEGTRGIGIIYKLK